MPHTNINKVNIYIYCELYKLTVGVFQVSHIVINDIFLIIVTTGNIREVMVPRPLASKYYFSYRKYDISPSNFTNGMK